jgi:hypothetical protein
VARHIRRELAINCAGVLFLDAIYVCELERSVSIHDKYISNWPQDITKPNGNLSQPRFIAIIASSVS